MRTLSGKRVLITGAGSGIGKSIAVELGRQGSRLFLLDINEEALADVVVELAAAGAEAVPRRCDISDPVQVDAAVQQLLDTFGGLDVLINNAGVVYYGATHEMSPAQWDQVVGVNLLGPIRLIHALLPTLRQQPEAHILNVASVTGLVPKRRIAAYQTTKFALVGLSQSLRAEYSPYGIGVTALCPGFVSTNLLDAAKQSGMTKREPVLRSWWVMSPDRVAKQAAKAIQRNRAVVVTPCLAKMFWWMQRLAPWVLDWHTHLVHWRSQRRKARKSAKAKAAPQVTLPSP